MVKRGPATPKGPGDFIVPLHHTHTHHHHRFRHHEYLHIKPVLIASLLVILVLIAAVLFVYFYTRPKDDDKE